MSAVSQERTGDPPRTAAKLVRVNFDQYEVVVTISESGEVAGIQEIRVRKDFRRPSQIGSVDFDDYKE